MNKIIDQDCIKIVVSQNTKIVLTKMTKRSRVTAEEVAEAFMMGQEYPDDLEDPDDLEEPTLEEDPDDLDEPMMEGSDEFSIVLGGEDISVQEERDDENLDPPEMDHSPPIQYPSVLDSPAPIQQSPTTPPSLPTSCSAPPE